jgi:hypothetical protein
MQRPFPPPESEQEVVSAFEVVARNQKKKELQYLNNLARLKPALFFLQKLIFI